MKLGDTVTGLALFGDGLKVTGKIIAKDAKISRDAIIIENEKGQYIVLEQSLLCPICNERSEDGLLCAGCNSDSDYCNWL